MKPAKEYYQTYRADNSLGDLNKRVIDIIASNPEYQRIFEFGCGTGKNLAPLHALQKVTFGLDISPLNVMASHFTNGLPYVMLGDEYFLGHLYKFDLAFTVSVLDHIEDVESIINNLKRMSQTVILAESDHHDPSIYYWNHDYKAHNFKKMDFTWSGNDGFNYNIWVWGKGDLQNMGIDDDLG